LSATASLPRTLAGTASSRWDRCQLVVPWFVGPELQYSPIQAGCQPSMTGIHRQPEIWPSMPLPHPEGLAKHAHCPCRAYAPHEGRVARRQWQPPLRHHEARGQLLQPQASTVLRQRPAPQARVDVLRVDRLLRARQLPAQVAQPCVAPVEQPRMEPAVEVLHPSVGLRLLLRDQGRPDTEAQTNPDHSRQGPCRRPPAPQLAGVVELSPLGDALILPSLPEEPQDLVHAARAGQAEADGAIEGVLAHPDGVVVAATIEIDRSPQVHLMDWLEARACGSGYSWQVSSGARRTRGAVKPLRCRARSMGAARRERTDAQGLQLGTDGRGPDQTIAGSRRGMGRKPADGEDGPLQFGWDPLRLLVAGLRPVVEALGSGLHSGR
jgi:hypothetical protein